MSRSRVLTGCLVAGLASVCLTGCADKTPAADGSASSAPSGPGALTQADKSTAEITNWLALPSITDAKGQVQVAPSGSKFVTVEVQFHGVTPETKCSFALVDAADQLIPTSAKAPVMGDVTSCQGAGSDPLVNVSFIVAKDKVDGLKGLSLDPSDKALALTRP